VSVSKMILDHATAIAQTSTGFSWHHRENRQEEAPEQNSLEGGEGEDHVVAPFLLTVQVLQIPMSMFSQPAEQAWQMTIPFLLIVPVSHMGMRNLSDVVLAMMLGLNPDDPVEASQRAGLESP
jgi:hypothetical protein